MTRLVKQWLPGIELGVVVSAGSAYAAVTGTASMMSSGITPSSVAA